MQRRFTSIDEPIADFKWQKLFRKRWPAYKAWINAGSPLKDAETSMAALRSYMPEMLPTHEHLCRLVNADELAVSFLSGYQPPAYDSACSQVVSTLGAVQLIRNYDYHVDRFEGTLLMTSWNGKKVIANSDCLVGVLDGMNEDGLAVSLTFGGRRIVGFGFGIPFILRYILEFCCNVDEAVEVLNRVPSHMSYNVTVTDKSGKIRTVEVAPDKTTMVTDIPFATNHQGAIDRAQNSDINKTAERADFIGNMLSTGVSDEYLIKSFLSPPLYNTRFSEGLGTLYTAVFRPDDGVVQLLWPNETMTQSFDNFSEEKRLINFNQSEKLHV